MTLAQQLADVFHTVAIGASAGGTAGAAIDILRLAAAALLLTLSWGALACWADPKRGDWTDGACGLALFLVTLAVLP